MQPRFRDQFRWLSQFADPKGRTLVRVLYYVLQGLMLRCNGLGYATFNTPSRRPQQVTIQYYTVHCVSSVLRSGLRRTRQLDCFVLLKCKAMNCTVLLCSVLHCSVAQHRQGNPVGGKAKPLTLAGAAVHGSNCTVMYCGVMVCSLLHCTILHPCVLYCYGL